MAGNRHRRDEAKETEQMQIVIQSYSDIVYRLAYAMMKNKSDADDIYQEVFLRFIRRAPVFHSPEHARAWMLRVTVNCCKNHWKSPWADGRMEPFWQEAENEKCENGMDDGDPAWQAQQRWQREQLRRSMKELPEKYRLLIHLYYYEELSTEEIAGLLRRRASTVRTQLVRARRLLRDILERDGYTANLE